MIDWKAVRWTTNGLLSLGGLVCWISFLATLHTFYLLLFLAASAGTWVLIYWILSRVRERGRENRILALAETGKPAPSPRKRWMLRALRTAVDHADERIHAEEVRWREELARVRESEKGRVLPAATDYESGPPPNTRQTFAEWEARRAGVLPAAAKPKRRRSLSLADFDRRFA